jgi:hypothetical protein
MLACGRGTVQGRDRSKTDPSESMRRTFSKGSPEKKALAETWEMLLGKRQCDDAMCQQVSGQQSPARMLLV